MDDLEAVRSIVEILDKFDDSEVQERIVRWSLEKAGLHVSGFSAGGGREHDANVGNAHGGRTIGDGTSDIRSFIAKKAPGSDNQFAAAVAYYYAFEAPEQERKGSISPTDLTEACRMAGRTRLGDPAKTLSNARGMGYLDKIDRGTYKLNTVGENLVAITLPGGNPDAAARTRKKAPARKVPRAKKGKSGKRK